MPGATPFEDLIRRLRAGEEQAAEELLREYGPALQRGAAPPPRRAAGLLAPARQTVLTPAPSAPGSGQGSAAPGVAASPGAANPAGSLLPGMAPAARPGDTYPVYGGGSSALLGT